MSFDYTNWDNCSLTSLSIENKLNTGNRVLPFGSEEYFFNLQNELQYLKGYNSCPPLKAIISKRAKAFNRGKTELINKKTKNFATGQEANRIKALLSKPNAIQSKEQFLTQQNIYVDVFGYCPVLKVKPSGMSDISAIWNIPPWLFDITYTNNWLNQNKISGIFKSYFMTWNGRKMELNFEDVEFIFDDGIGSEIDTNLLIPDSRLVSLEYPVTNIIASYKSRNTLITKRGAIGILSNESQDSVGTVALEQDEKDSIQNDFKKYGITGQPYQIIVSDARLKWQQMGFNTKELMLFEEIEDDINRLCDAYGYPSTLLSRSKDVTFDNKKQGSKDLYRDTIIPESESRMQQLTKIIAGENSNIVIKKDFSDIEVLQEEIKQKAEGRKAMNEALKVEYENGLITKNDWLEALGYDRREDTEFDKYKDNENITSKDNRTQEEV